MKNIQSNLEFILNTPKLGELNINLGGNISNLLNITNDIILKHEYNECNALKIRTDSNNKIKINTVKDFCNFQDYKYSIYSDKCNKIRYIAINIKNLSKEDLDSNRINNNGSNINISELSDNLKIVGDRIGYSHALYDITTFKDILVMINGCLLFFYYDNTLMDLVDNRLELERAVMCDYLDVAKYTYGMW